MPDNHFLNGLLPQKKQSKGPEQPRVITRYQQLMLIFCFVGVLLYPFSFMGALPLVIVQAMDRKDRAAHLDDMDYDSLLIRKRKLFMSLSFLLAGLNVLCFLLFIPRGYLSTYLLFPLNLLQTTLQVTWQTFLAFVLGGCGMGSVFVTFAAFMAQRRVISKEETRKKITQSKAYQDRKKHKFSESQRYTEEHETRYEVALRGNQLPVLSQLKEELLLGTSEFGLPYVMGLSELNQHALIPATTGSGKTVLLLLLVQQAVKFQLPLILIDGKGNRETLEGMATIASYYDQTVEAFTDEGDMRYNPVEYGNDISIRDKLVTLAETESVFYSGAAKALLQVTIQLLDEFKGTRIQLAGTTEKCAAIERSLPFVQTFLLPRNVLHLFADAILTANPNLFELTIEKKITPSKKQTADKKKKILADLADFDDQTNPSEEEPQPLNRKMEDLEAEGIAPIETETITLDPTTLDLEAYYLLLKRNVKYLKKRGDQTETSKQQLFERLFIRYEHKTSPFYLYATSEALQTNLNMLLDSQLGKLFEPKAGEKKLDIQEIAQQNKLVYVSLNGLIYKEYIRTLAQMLVGDVNYYAAEMYRTNQKKGMFVIFDEPASYLNETFIDMVNKGRGAGIYAVFSPQTMADIAKLGDNLLEQLVGNVNTLMIGKTNEPGEAEYWSNAIGTYEDIEITNMTEQEAGFSDVDKTDWTGSRGTKRNVDKFKINPNRIKALRTGEFVVYRTAQTIHVPPQVVYVRNVLEWLEKQPKTTLKKRETVPSFKDESSEEFRIKRRRLR